MSADGLGLGQKTGVRWGKKRGGIRIRTRDRCKGKVVRIESG